MFEILWQTNLIFEEHSASFKFQVIIFDFSLIQIIWNVIEIFYNWQSILAH